jgi:hypothetical protein
MDRRRQGSTHDAEQSGKPMQFGDSPPTSNNGFAIFNVWLKLAFNGITWHLLYNTVVAARRRYTFWIDESQANALKDIKARDGVPEAEQLRRAIALWIAEKKTNVGGSPETRPVRSRKHARSKS